MSETKKLLSEEYERLNEQLKVVDVQSNQYGEVIELRDSIRKDMIKCDSMQLEKELKREEIEAANRREKHRNIIDIFLAIGTGLLTIWSTCTTLDFDREHTITSTAGRGIINNGVLAFNKMVDKLFKRK